MKGIKVRVRLDDDKSLGFGTLIKHCGVAQQVNYHAMEPGNWWECAKCNKPVLLVTETGWYEVGNKLQF